MHEKFLDVDKFRAEKGESNERMVKFWTLRVVSQRKKAENERNIRKIEKKAQQKSLCCRSDKIASAVGSEKSSKVYNGGISICIIISDERQALFNVSDRIFTGKFAYIHNQRWIKCKAQRRSIFGNLIPERMYEGIWGYPKIVTAF